MIKLSTRIGALLLGLVFLASVLIASGCGSSSDVQPDAKSNYSQPMSKKAKAGPMGGTE